jgi:hypothetical protein
MSEPRGVHKYLPDWIDWLKKRLYELTGRDWHIYTDSDGVSFQFKFRLDDIKADSICWTMTRVARKFDSIDAFLEEVARWPVKKMRFEQELKEKGQKPNV